jgi:preprotein translocase SecE subunit
MADKPAKKRIVKNPETFRERAVKAAEGNDKPARTAALRQAGSKVTSPISRAAGRLASNKAAKPLRKPARIVGKILLPTYFRKSWQELRQVEWPSFRQSLRLTGAVIIFAIIFGAIVAVVDYGLDKLFRNVLIG